MPSPIDTSRTTEIAASPAKLALMIALGLGFVAVGYWMTLATVDTPRYSAAMVRALGYLSITVFGFFLLIALWRLLTQRGPVITLSPVGLRDVRVSNDVIPWQAINSLKTWQMSGQQVMVVGLIDGEEAKLKLTTIARMSRGANARLGADGLAMTAQGTKISHAELMDAAIAYAERYGRQG